MFAGTILRGSRTRTKRYRTRDFGEKCGQGWLLFDLCGHGRLKRDPNKMPREPGGALGAGVGAEPGEGFDTNGPLREVSEPGRRCVRPMLRKARAPLSSNEFSGSIQWMFMPRDHA